MAGMNDDWLQQLAPAHAPAPVGWWPLAPGWWGVIILLLLLVLAGVAVYLHHRRKPPTPYSASHLRGLALSEIARIALISDDAMLARELTLLLRRYALSQFGRAQVAGLSGEAWLDFVVQHGGLTLQGDSGRQLLQAAYGGSFHAQRASWLAGARGFVEAAR